MKATIATNSSNSLKKDSDFIYSMLKTKLTVFFSKKIVCFRFGNSKVTIKKFIKRVNKV